MVRHIDRSGLQPNYEVHLAVVELHEANCRKPIHIFVHLARNKDLAAWREGHAKGTLIGVNDETPYGYARAENMGCIVEFSSACEENLSEKLTRLCLRALLGFDLVHAWRQRAAISRADVVWTHTESQYLAVAAILRHDRKRPKLLGQTVWLLDRWRSLTFLHRAWYRRLVREVDVLTFHSPLNLEQAKALFPKTRAELVRFGIPTDRVSPPRRRSSNVIRVLALGNDRHRDWACLIDAVADMPDMKMRILSNAVTARMIAGAGNIEIGRARSQNDLLAAFDEASVVCVPLHANLHASGITVIQEAVIAGVPVVATDTGGLDAYFTHNEIKFVPIGASLALRAAIREIAADPLASLAQAQRAQSRMNSGELGAESYIRRHVELTRDMMST